MNTVNANDVLCLRIFFRMGITVLHWLISLSLDTYSAMDANQEKIPQKEEHVWGGFNSV